MIIFCTHFDPFLYRYFNDPLIDIDFDIDIFQNLLVDIAIDIDIFQNLLVDIDIDIDIFQNLLDDIDIDIDIFQNLLVDIDIFKNDHVDIDIDIDIFQKCRYIDNRYSISIYRTGLSPPGVHLFSLPSLVSSRVYSSPSCLLG